MKEINIVIPSTILENCNNLFEKTIKIGQIARIIAIFKVKTIFLLKTKTNYDFGLTIIKKILEYLVTPQYLRKKRFSIDKDLKYVGTLPPLATYLHHLSKTEDNLKNGEIREGYLIEKKDNYIFIDIGIEKPIKLTEKVNEFKDLSRIYVKIEKKINKFYYSLIEKNDIHEYIGYDIKIVTLTNLLRNKDIGLILGTSKKGKKIFEIISRIKNEIKEHKSISLIFGSAKLDIFKLFKKYSINIDENIPYIINFLPEQGVRTIRTEEAISIALTSLSFLINT
ncbi:MAG: hypothetical protein EAX96_09795 [Candidatus Lokiarchaeota archaeon]|nr:hypothetical protein [Candidatus Lokiarchaeota archaeon]